MDDPLVIDLYDSADPMRLSDAGWEWVQSQRWEDPDGTPYLPQREDTYWAPRDALIATEGWVYRVE